MESQTTTLANLSSYSKYKSRDNSTMLSDTVLTNNFNDITLNSDSTSELLSTLTQTELSLRFDQLNKEGKTDEIIREIQRKEFSHKNQLLELELSQQHLKYETLLAQHLTEKEDLMEKLHETQSKMRVLENQLKNTHAAYIPSRQLTNNTTTLPSNQEQIMLLEKLKNKVLELETRDEELRFCLSSTQINISNILTLEEFNRLKQCKLTMLSVHDQIRLIMFQATQSLRAELSEMKKRLDGVNRDCYEFQNKASTLKEQLRLKEQTEGEIKKELNTVIDKNQIMQIQLNTNDYKLEHYDKLNQERLEMRHSLDEALKLNVELDIGLTSQTKKVHGQNEEIITLKQSNSLLAQDKHYLSKQAHDFQTRNDYLQDKLTSCEYELKQIKESRESLYEKSIITQQVIKSEYENKLNTEINLIRVNTQDEIENLRQTARNLHDREIESLKDSRNAAKLERDTISSEFKQLQQKHEYFLTEYRVIQQTCDAKTVQLEQELKMARFDLEKSQILQSEYIQNLKQIQIENEKLKKQLDLSTQVCYSKDSENVQYIAKLEASNSELHNRLATYDSIETDLNEVITEAAQLENNEENNRILTVLGIYDAAMTRNSSSVLKRSTHLARKVLTLEKCNLDLQQELTTCKNNLEETTGNYESVQYALSLTKQPYSYITDLLQKKEVEITESNRAVDTLNEKNNILEQDNSKLLDSRSALAQDLHRLIGKSEEIHQFKESLIAFKKNLQSRHGKELGFNREPVLFMNS